MLRSEKLNDNKETKERLIESALSEFSEKGCTKASLRKICAGITTRLSICLLMSRTKKTVGIMSRIMNFYVSGRMNPVLEDKKKQ